MAVENFLPRDRDDRIILGPDGQVRRIVAACQGKEIVFIVKDGRLRRCCIPNMPFFDIPKDKLGPLYRQIAAVISDREKNAKLAEEIKRPEWSHSLKKCGLDILPDGRITIPRWIADKAGGRRLIRQTVKDINAAVRMQDHIMKKYSYKAELANGSEVPEAIWELLKKFAIIQPHLELRREALIHARGQMEAAIKEALVRLNKITASTVKNGGKRQVLADKIARLSFFLKNSWACPYLTEVNQVIQALNQAKRAIDKPQLLTAQLLLLRAKHHLGRLIDNFSQGQSGLAKLGEIDPIKTLGQINRLNKADEVLRVAKKLLPGSRAFYLADLLVISRMVLAGKSFARPAEQISLNFDG